MDKLIWYRQEMQKLKEEGAFPWTLPPGENFGVALIALDEVFDLPDEIKRYMARSFPNGHPHFCTIETLNPNFGTLSIRLGNVSSPAVRYLRGDTEEAAKARRSGLLKWIVMQAWKRGKEDNLL